MPTTPEAEKSAKDSDTEDINEKNDDVEKVVTLELLDARFDKKSNIQDTHFICSEEFRKQSCGQNNLRKRLYIPKMNSLLVDK